MKFSARGQSARKKPADAARRRGSRRSDVRNTYLNARFMDATPNIVSGRSTTEIFEHRANRTGQFRPVARLSQSLAQFELHALTRTASIANVAGMSAREAMPIGRARDSDLRQGLRKLFLEPFIQSPQQHVGSGGSISVHGNDGVAARDEIEGTRLVEPMAGKVQAVEIVAGRS